jgi:hypothetical protein
MFEVASSPHLPLQLAQNHSMLYNNSSEATSKHEVIRQLLPA